MPGSLGHLIYIFFLFGGSTDGKTAFGILTDEQILVADTVLLGMLTGGD